MSQIIEQPVEALPLACLLPKEAQAQRGQDIRELFKAVSEVRELTDGYQFRFPGEGTWAAKLLDFILFERQCCPFFTFELVFAPNHDSLWLGLRGPEGVKAVVESAFADVSIKRA